MYYKVIRNDRVIDALDRLTYVRYDKRHDAIYLCEPTNADGFLSSDRSTCWAVRQMLPSKFDLVDLVQIDKDEYLQLRALNMKTPQEIIDAYTLALIEGGIL